ncbi:proteoglycan 3 [Gymnodraco acuticeps]|uniref:Proteoglycan 3 n=1 Tax=Gymnodraco acuticeps TaxID=8218 RepID=A0A6P8TYW0_GYMAC|nr:proteoglycan 3 [Gymnodraco acuticeps]
MELEPLEDDNMNGEKLSSRSEVNTEIRYEMVGEPIMELEPLENKDTEQTEEEGGPALDIFGQPRKTSEEYFPNEEARMGSPMVDGSNYLMMDETASEFFQTDQISPMAADSPVMNHVREPRALRRQAVNNPEERRSSPKHNKQGQSCSPGVMIEGKCYQFFKEPKKAADAEFFCQDHFSGGHLASISSPHVHREVMNLIRQNGGLTRTWVGGLRYLETGRFIWLDGSHWGFADWLSGEPNNTSDLEDCVELLPQGNGKFNDFTCWEPQAFVCSY